MSVTSEPRFRVNNCLPDTSALRKCIAEQVIRAERNFNSGWKGECERLGEDYVVAYLRDVVLSLPDADILDLAYIKRTGGSVYLARDFCDKLTEYNILRDEINQISVNTEQ